MAEEHERTVHRERRVVRDRNAPGGYRVFYLVDGEIVREEGTEEDK